MLFLYQRLRWAETSTPKSASVSRATHWHNQIWTLYRLFSYHQPVGLRARWQMQVEEFHALNIVVEALARALIEKKLLSAQDIKDQLPHPNDADNSTTLSDKAVIAAWQRVNYW